MSPREPKARIVMCIRNVLSGAPNELRIDVAERANAEARFNAPPHQSELNGRSLPA
jgi:hypothetical protein